MKTLCVCIAVLLVFPLSLTASIPQAEMQDNLDLSINGGATEITLEAESAVLTGPMKISVDGQAFGNLCINGYKDNRRGWAVFEVMIPKEDDYVIWGRMRGRDGYTNSFFFQVDNGPNYLWETYKDNKWEWDRVSDRGTGSVTYPQTDPVIFHLKAGKHKIVVGNREKETRLDRLVITNDQKKYYADEPATWIKLQAPKMADLIVPGSTFEVLWGSGNLAEKVNIDLSVDLGKTFNIPVVHNTDNDGQHLWQVPTSLYRPKVIMRISAASGKPYDENSGYFAVISPSEVKLTLLNPIGGETITANTIYLINWKEYAFNGIVSIDFSSDNGATWTTFADNQNAGGTNYWNVPNIVSDKCLIKIKDSADGTPWDMSKSTFKIVASPTSGGKGASDDRLAFAAMPDSYTLSPNFPNPFNPQTTITYGLPEAGNFKLTVYDMRGREIATLAEGFGQAGWHQATWNAGEFPSGVYTTVLQAGSQRTMQRMTLVK